MKVELEPENTKDCHDSDPETNTWVRRREININIAWKKKKKGGEKKENIGMV